MLCKCACRGVLKVRRLSFLTCWSNGEYTWSPCACGFYLRALVPSWIRKTCMLIIIIHFIYGRLSRHSRSLNCPQILPNSITQFQLLKAPACHNSLRQIASIAVTSHTLHLLAGVQMRSGQPPITASIDRSPISACAKVSLGKALLMTCL